MIASGATGSGPSNPLRPRWVWIIWAVAVGALVAILAVLVVRMSDPGDRRDHVSFCKDSAREAYPPSVIVWRDVAISSSPAVAGGTEWAVKGTASTENPMSATEWLCKVRRNGDRWEMIHLNTPEPGIGVLQDRNR